MAYWADENTPAFDVAGAWDGAEIKGVVGPIWIAVNIGTLPGDTDGIRFWLSVPTGAVIDEETLAVYFVANRANYELTTDPLGADEVADRDDIYNSLADLDRVGNGTFESCVGVHLMKLSDIQAQVEAIVGSDRLVLDEDGNTVVVEAIWATEASGSTYKVDAEKELLYLWLPDGVEFVLTAPNLAVASPEGPLLAHARSGRSLRAGHGSARPRRLEPLTCQVQTQHFGSAKSRARPRRNSQFWRDSDRTGWPTRSARAAPWTPTRSVRWRTFGGSTRRSATRRSYRMTVCGSTRSTQVSGGQRRAKPDVRSRGGMGALTRPARGSTSTMAQTPRSSPRTASRRRSTQTR